MQDWHFEGPGGDLESFFILIDNSIEFHYSKNGKEYKVGQEHLYEDPCDEWLDLVDNKLTSPNFPKAYDPLTECSWNLTAPLGHYVSLDFEIIDVSNMFYLKYFHL